MKYTYHMVVDGNETTGTYDSIETCLNELMSLLFNTLGDGDGENGGEGSLWRCAKEIYDSIARGIVFKYADCSFYISTSGKEETEEIEDKEYTFGFSAVVSNQITVRAKNYQEAREKYLKKRVEFMDDLMEAIVETKTDWDYDRNVNDEFENFSE